MRPKNFELDYGHSLARGLVFAGLGAHAGGNHYHDSSVFGKPGTNTNMEPGAWVQAHGRNGLVFDGSDEYVNGSNRPYLVSADPITFSWWMRPTGVDEANHWIIGESAASGIATNGCAVRKYSTGLLAIHAPHTSSCLYDLAGIVTAGQLQHWAMTISATSGLNKAYRDGVDITAGFTIATANYDPYTNTANPITIGRASTNTYTYEGYFDGELYDVMVWTRALSPAEIAQLADPSNVMLSGMLQSVGNIYGESIYDLGGIR